MGLDKKDVIYCPTCGQKIGLWVPSRICGLCHKPIRKGHKWQIDNSLIRHRICDDPYNYRSKV